MYKQYSPSNIIYCGKSIPILLSVQKRKKIKKGEETKEQDELCKMFCVNTCCHVFVWKNRELVYSSHLLLGGPSSQFYAL